MNAIITRTGPVLPLGLYPANFTSSAPKFVAFIPLQHVGGSRSLPSYLII